MGQVFNTVYPIKTRVRATMVLELQMTYSLFKWDELRGVKNNDPIQY